NSSVTRRSQTRFSGRHSSGRAPTRREQSRELTRTAAHAARGLRLTQLQFHPIRELSYLESPKAPIAHLECRQRVRASEHRWENGHSPILFLSLQLGSGLHFVRNDSFAGAL